jgi:hypothetical protein
MLKGADELAYMILQGGRDLMRLYRAKLSIN